MKTQEQLLCTRNLSAFSYIIFTFLILTSWGDNVGFILLLLGS